MDDGSTDNTINLLESKYSNKITCIQQENKGVSSARNIGIQNSIGEWIAFLDSDDYWLPNKLEIQMEFIEENPNVYICQTGETWIRNGKRVNPKKIHKKYSGWIFEYCLPLCIVSPSAVMIKKSLLEHVGLFDENFPACEDYDLWLRISKDYPIHLIQKELIVKHGGHQDQLSRKYWGMDRFRVQSMLKLLESKQLNDWQRERTIIELYRKCDVLVNGFIKRGKLKDAEFYENIKRLFF